MTLKTKSLFALGMVAFGLFVGGCKPKFKAPATVDPSVLQQSFASADANTKAIVDLIISDINSTNYEQSIIDLQRLNGEPGITPEQQKVILGVTSYVNQKSDEMWKKRVGNTPVHL